MAEKPGRKICYRAACAILEAMTDRFVKWAKLAEQSGAPTPVAWHFSDAYDEDEAARIIGRETGLWNGSDPARTPVNEEDE